MSINMVNATSGFMTPTSTRKSPTQTKEPRYAKIISSDGSTRLEMEICRETGQAKIDFPPNADVNNGNLLLIPKQKRETILCCMEDGCSETFTKASAKNDLWRHFTSKHLKHKAYGCTSCALYLKTTKGIENQKMHVFHARDDNFKQHLRSSLHIQWANFIKEKFISLDRLNLFVCGVCKKYFKTYNELHAHVSLIHLGRKRVQTNAVFDNIDPNDAEVYRREYEEQRKILQQKATDEEKAIRQHQNLALKRERANSDCFIKTTPIKQRKPALSMTFKPENMQASTTKGGNTTIKKNELVKRKPSPPQQPQQDLDSSSDEEEGFIVQHQARAEQSHVDSVSESSESDSDSSSGEEMSSDEETSSDSDEESQESYNKCILCTRMTEALCCKTCTLTCQECKRKLLTVYDGMQCLGCYLSITYSPNHI